MVDIHNPRQFAADKILHHLKEVQEWKDGGNPYAITTEIDPTNACNHSCPGCVGGARKGKGSDRLAYSELQGILWEIKELGGKAVTFTGGGEPLLNKSTVSAIEYARLIGLDVGLITNGSRGVYQEYPARELVDACTWIRISLDAGTPIMHQATHGSSDFSEILKNISSMTEYKRREKSRCVIGIGYLTGVGTNNHPDLIDFINCGISTGVDYAQFRPYHIGNAKKNLSDFETLLDLDDLLSRGTESMQVLCSRHKYNCITEGILKPQYGKCYGHQFIAVIEATGDMTLCCHTRGIKNFILGNIREKFIIEIWNSDRRREVIKSINLEKCTPLCRADTVNCLLWQMKQEKEHVNFL